MSSQSSFNNPSKGGLKKREGKAGKPKEPEQPVQPVQPVIQWVPEIPGMPRPLFVKIMDLHKGMCKWPYGERNFFFCGLPSGHKIYCKWHLYISYRGMPK